MTRPSAPARTGDAVIVEQARYLHRTYPTNVAGTILVAVILSGVFRDAVGRAGLVAWVGLLLAQGAVRIFGWRRERPAAYTAASARRWIRQAVAGFLVSGLVWSAGMAWLLRHEAPLLQLVVAFTIVAMIVTSVFSTGILLPAFLAWFVPTFATAIVTLLLQGKTLQGLVAGGLALFALVIFNVARIYQRTFLEAMRLRFENEDLVAQLTVQKEAAEAANLSKSRFLAAASHDLRQPMHALELYLGTLPGPDLPPRVPPLVARLRQCAATMDAMFRALLDISRLDASAVEARPEDFPLAPLFARLQAEFEPQARERGLRLRVAGTRAWVRADPELLERVVRNFLANAVGHTRAGGVVLGCRRAGGDAVRIVVCDTGPGIPPDQQRAVFEEFHQLRRGGGERRGMGLGLAIVERLARLLQGRVTLVSIPGRGSTFGIEIARLPAPARAMPAAVASASPPVVDGLRGRLVVVVDDDPEIVAATAALLRRWDCEVATAGSGAEAVDRLARSTRAPDCIVCDYRLPGAADGIEAIELLRSEFNEEIPALLVTGDTGVAPLQAVRASGLPVLHKPIEAEALRETLLRLMRAG